MLDFLIILQLWVIIWYNTEWNCINMTFLYVTIGTFCVGVTKGSGYIVTVTKYLYYPHVTWGHWSLSFWRQVPWVVNQISSVASQRLSFYCGIIWGFVPDKRKSSPHGKLFLLTVRSKILPDQKNNSYYVFRKALTLAKINLNQKSSESGRKINFALRVFVFYVNYFCFFR